MSAPWTPGPWVVSGQKSIRTKAPSGRLNGWVAKANHHNGAANARLIAEAPTMVELLAAWIEPWNGFSELETARRADPATLDRIRTTRALLARVKGEG